MIESKTCNIMVGVKTNFFSTLSFSNLSACAKTHGLDLYCTRAAPLFWSRTPYARRFYTNNSLADQAEGKDDHNGLERACW